jgi:hypothetical protein
MNWTSVLLPSGYFALFAISAFAILWWDRRKRGTRIPFSRDLRLMRMAGETHLKDVAQFDEDFLFVFMLAALVPCLAAIILFEVLGHLKGGWLWAVLGLTIAVFVVAFGLATRWFVRRLRARSDSYLGFFGERVVAEFLEPAKTQGWRVFHDVPCESGRERFNIDHVAVGPGGVYAIETKTRRKGPTREGRDDYKVFYDGEKLDWPWGDDQDGLGLAIGHAQWLQNWLTKTTGAAMGVVPVLALPGWYVESPARAAVRVVNPSWLPDLLTGSAETTLSARQIDLYTRQIEQRCRDVEY